MKAFNVVNCPMREYCEKTHKCQYDIFLGRPVCPMERITEAIRAEATNASQYTIDLQMTPACEDQTDISLN